MRSLIYWFTSEGLGRFEIEMWAYYRKDTGVLANWRNIGKAPYQFHQHTFTTAKTHG